MRIKNVFIGWATLNLLAIIIASVRIIEKRPYYITLTVAILMFIVLVYELISLRVDGPLFFISENDERLWDISYKSKSNAFWFLFVSVWCLALTLELFDPVSLKKYVALFLAAIGAISLFTYMFSFIWHKYKVQR
jgi:hypothetical protein